MTKAAEKRQGQLSPIEDCQNEKKKGLQVEQKSSHTSQRGNARQASKNEEVKSVRNIG